MLDSGPKTHAALLGSRLVIAAVFLWHGIPKAFNISAAMEKFVGFGLPGVLGPVTGWVEVLAAVALVLGVFSRWGALALVVVIVGALVTVQIPGGISTGLERDLLILSSLLLLAAAGPGRYRVRGTD
ncbi:MAG: DoxX family protein [Gemmatimonadota bacterium]